MSARRQVEDLSGVEGRPAPGAWTAAIILALAACLCWADRLLPALLLEPIKAAFGLTDTRMALLTGFSFAIATAVFAVPLSWVADRFNRAWLISATIALWCVMTVACAFAQGFWSLFVCRLGVGLGEAVLMPAAYSLLADLFPPRLLPRALSLYVFGCIIGNAVAMNGGGLVYEGFQHLAAAGVQGFAAADAWRWTTASFGLAGLAIAAAAALLLPEPRRAMNRQAIAPQASLLDYLNLAKFFVIPFTVSTIAYCLYESGLNGWLAPFLTRTYGWSIGQIGQVLGLSTVAGTLLGMPLGVWANQLMSARLGREAPVATVCALMVVSLPAIVAAPFAPSGALAVVGFTLALTAGAAASVISPVVFTSTAPPHLRARMIAVSNLFFGLFGKGFGALLYALVTDKVLRDPLKLNVSLSLVSAGLMAVVIPALFIADRRYGRATALAERHARLATSGEDDAPVAIDHAARGGALG